jgi:hypothetical protein
MISNGCTIIPQCRLVRNIALTLMRKIHNPDALDALSDSSQFVMEVIE